MKRRGFLGGLAALGGAVTAGVATTAEKVKRKFRFYPDSGYQDGTPLTDEELADLLQHLRTPNGQARFRSEEHNQKHNLTTRA